MWIKILDEKPPENVSVKTKIDDEHGCRNRQNLIRKGNLYFSDGMYVYYMPTHWFKD